MQGGKSNIIFGGSIFLAIFVIFLFCALRYVLSNCFGEDNIEKGFLPSNIPPMIQQDHSSFLGEIYKAVFGNDHNQKLMTCSRNKLLFHFERKKSRPLL